MREKLLELGVSQISGGSKTSVGGYYKQEKEDSSQFEVNDNRTLDEVVYWLMKLNYLPSFCTACYGNNRTGEKFMSLCKEKQIHNFCHPNAIMTLKEYLTDYASNESKLTGEKLIQSEISKIKNETIKQSVLTNISKISNGERNFKF